MRLAKALFLVIALFAGTPAAGAPLAPQHDANCLEVYNATTPTAFLHTYDAGTLVLDDLHANLAGNAALCAFTLQVRNLDGTAAAHTMTISFYGGDAADGVPGALTAGPFVVPIPAVAGDQLVHFEAPSGYITPNAWIGFNWDTPQVAVRIITGATIGATHDLVYYPAINAYDDFGTLFAGYYADVFTSPPVPAKPATWGALKGIYR
jgi:hypothetical protein